MTVYEIMPLRKNLENRGDSRMIDKQSRTVNASFDETFEATAFGGLALAERAASKTGLWRLVEQHLPERQRATGYSFVSAFAATVYGLLLGGRGFSAGELVRDDSEVRKALGLEDGVPKDCSMHRIYCDAAGIPWRSEDEWYDPDNDRYKHKAHGRERKFVRGARRVGEMELADQDMLESLQDVLCDWVPRLLALTLKKEVRWGRWIPLFGDATQLEVEGNCFEGATKDYNGNVGLQWQTVWLARYLCAQKLRPGSAYEPAEMPEMLEQGCNIATTAGLKATRLLALMDSAYAEKPVFEKLRELKIRYVIGGNGLREHLEKRAREQPQSVWKSGWHSNSKYRNVKYCTFYYQAETWKKKEVVVALRYDADDSPLFPEQRYHFLFTDLTEHDIGPDKSRLRMKSFAETIFAIYHHKQARENNYKTPLIDMNLHHPPSGRFGANQVLYAVASIAVNLYVTLTTSAMHKKQRGIRLTTMRVRYFLIAAKVATGARQTRVRLARAISERRRRDWLYAFERIKRW